MRSGFWSITEIKVKKMNNSKKREMLSTALLAVGISVFLGLICIVNIFHFNYTMNADLASDVILGRLIWESKEILPSTWYVANEVRIICTPNVTALFYGLIQNMTLAAGLACCIMAILIPVSSIYFGKALGLNLKENLLFSFLGLAIPSNLIILELLYLFADYYAIHVVVLFFTLGVYGEAIKNKRMKWGRLTVSLLLALCLGVQGVRGILVLYGPLFGIEIIRNIYRIYRKTEREKVDSLISLWVTSLLFISFLGTLFPISVGQGFSRNIRQGFYKLVTVVIPDMGRAIGFHSIDWPGKICLGIMALIILYLLADILLRMCRKKDIEPIEWSFLVVCGSPVVSALTVAFTTVDSTERYYFLFVFAMAFAVVLILRKMCLKGVWELGAGVLIAGYAIINIGTTYLPIIRAEEPPKTEFYEVSRFLEENNYLTAYATFENANTITVLSNSRIRVAPVASVDKMDICKWMSSTEWYVPNVPFEEETAYIITEAEEECFKEFLLLHEGEVHFKTQIGKFLIYVSDYNFSRLD